MVNGDGSGFTGLQDQQDGRTGRKIGFESANTSELKDWQEGKMGARGLAQRARERGRRECFFGLSILITSGGTKACSDCTGATR